MKLPKAGWLSIVPNKNTLEFVPLRRYPKKQFPGMVSAIIGRHTKAKIRFNPHGRPSQSHHTPARLRHLSRKNHYQAGPFVAILTSNNKKPFGGNHQNFADLIRTGREMGVTVFVLTPQGIGNHSTVNGYLLDPHSVKPRWKAARLPFPNVVYNRIPNRMIEKTPEVRQTIRQLQQMPGVYLFNPGFFDKWTLYQQLAASPDLHRLLPETVRLHHMEQLESMAAKHPVLYFKPVEGKAGIKMMRLDKKKQHYELSYQTTREKKKYRVRTLKEVWDLYNRLKQKTAYILQQGIPLATFHGHPFDIRILLQKNGTGRWGLSGMGVRVAGERAISTHVPMGGHIEKIDTVLQSVFDSETDRIKERIEQVGIRTARWIENQQNALLGEMSMDLGIEKDGSLWIFEANSKPMKFDEPNIRRRSLRRLIEYSLYLSGFSHTSEGTAT
ncbi:MULTISPECIES: YheC/YheD family protein [unclassified Thermoactinomyces]|jgi:hypothetical protein|uniref:YheC/YheD family endospore coat-associated protein n=1 Tax=unclassified Thermoactinomyces TaxID=2634588 RepID=UPI00068F0ED4|nr:MULTISPECIES: YheC/YheD family protein [unclassified Thermoactinomyces]MBI0390572.1 YheC/YheD family protein [Thermoactinomyces sp. CICC 24226]